MAIFTCPGMIGLPKIGTRAKMTDTLISIKIKAISSAVFNGRIGIRLSFYIVRDVDY